MNILFPLTTNGRLPINNSLKKICISVASLKKENENIKVFGHVQEIIMDISYNQLISEGVEILPNTSKSIIKNIFNVRKLIINKQIDIVHCAGFKKLVFYYISTMLLKRRPLIIMSDRSTERWENRLAVYQSSFILWLTRPYLHVLNNNHFQYLKDKKILFKEIIMMPNIAETYEDNSRPKINLQNKKFNVCYAKNIRLDTGHDDIIDLGRKIKANKSQILIHILGEGALYQKFLKKISQYNLEDVIKTHGLLKHSEVVLNIRDMDLGITTSPIEMMPNFLLDCFIAGLPAVGYRTPGVEDLIRDGFNGYLINLGDTEAFLKCIESFLQDSSKLSCMSKNAHSSALEYMPVTIGNKWLKFYKKIMG